jgi:predicted Ser/Thr protein kinase
LKLQKPPIGNLSIEIVQNFMTNTLLNICFCFRSGEGTFGKVYKASYKGRTVAVKKLKLPSNLSQDVQNIYMNFRKEVEILW